MQVLRLRLLWAAIDWSTDWEITELVALAQLSSFVQTILYARASTYTLWLEC